MIDLLPEAIGIGLAISLLFTEVFGLAAGGMVVPGYIALYMNAPTTVATTLAAGVVTWGIVRLVGTVVILYGRRMTAMAILVGYLVGAATSALVPGAAGTGPGEFEVIGFVIPGLIAIWIHRQGLVETLTAIVTVSAVTRLALVLLMGEALSR